MPKTTFLTVFGGSPEEYDFVLGTLEKQLAFGRVILLDTSIEGARRFRTPPGVDWHHCGLFGTGSARFRFATALNVAIGLAEENEPEVLVQCDSDEYFESDLVHALEWAAQGTVIDVKTLHHIGPGQAINFPDEWHRRIWPARRGIRYKPNPRHANPEYHPIVDVPLGIPIERETRTFQHHLHYAVGRKKTDRHTAETTIPGWPDQGEKVTVPPWPPLIAFWEDGGARPSAAFEELRP